MKRRDFFALVVIATVGWPLRVRSQQVERVYRVAWVAATSPLSELVGASPHHPYARAFLDGLRDLGYIDGKNLVIELRSAEGKLEELPEIIRQLVANNVDVIVSPTSVVTQAAKGVTSTVPVVMAGNAIPVEFGFVKSLSRPGGNITGLAMEVGVEIAGKKLEFLKELVPEATRIAWLGSEEAHFTLKQQIVDTARTLGVDLLTLEHAPNDYVGAFARMTRERANAVFVGASNPNFVNRRLIVDLASRSRLPALYYTREFVDAGGLISYGVSLPDLNRRAALYVDKILKGTQPADLPIEQPTKFELVINLKTAKALGLVIPPTLLARADEVIE